MKAMMHRQPQAGFTVTELLIAAAMVLAVGFFLQSQWQYFTLADRNAERKTAINATHYYLQEVYFPANNSYPAVLRPDDIDAINAAMLQDPAGRPISSPQSDLRYQPGECQAGKCQRYELRADLERAEDFIRSSD